MDFGYGLLWNVINPNEKRPNRAFYHTGVGIHMLGVHPSSVNKLAALLWNLFSASRAAAAFISPALAAMSMRFGLSVIPPF